MTMKDQLEGHCELHWWNGGRKTLSFKGSLQELLKQQGVKYTKRKTEDEGIYTFYFKNAHGISFKKTGLIHDFSHLAKQFIQMELVRMGDKSQLYISTSGWRPTVTVNH